MEVFLLFMLYSFFGCVLEDVYHLVISGRYVSKRTMLSLPLCPVYGAAAIVLAAVNNTDNPILLFVNGFFAVSAVELMFYLISERIYGIKWWDYSNLRINLFGGISLAYSVMWGMINIVFALFVHPACSVWIKTLPNTAKLFGGVFSAVYFWSDLKETHRELLKYKIGAENRINEKFRYIKNNN